MVNFYIFFLIQILFFIYSYSEFYLFKNKKNFLKKSYIDETFNKHYSNRTKTNIISNNEDKIEITLISGGIKITKTETVLLLKSIFLQRTSFLILNIATDNESKTYLDKIFSELIDVKPKFKINFKIIDLNLIKKKSIEAKIPIIHHSGLWGITKLFLDQLFPEVNLTIYIDTDMVFGTDPILLYKNFLLFNDKTVFSWTREQNWINRGNSFVCSCIMLWNMTRSREIEFIKKASFAALNIYGKDFTNGLISKKKLKRGDQGVFYALNKIFPLFFLKLDSSWNLSFCRGFFGVSSKSHKIDLSGNFLGALHFNCLGNNYTDFKGWEWLINYYKWYRWDWINKPYKII